MTKAEKAEMDALRDELALARALGWSRMALPVRMLFPGNDHNPGYVNGWSFYLSDKSVVRLWSEGARHGEGHRTDGGGWHPGQNAWNTPKLLYATELEALIALRLALEQECAKSLAEVDAWIEKEREL